ncbi:MAG: 5-formyltetrahydrofolate cyclo-ligase [Paraglaciecola sp.]|nr:5-formyltetrahydrofolate cyclo-ligase [Paraglaciecola sp.]NCT49531.1 5-formyltetrahydrofolate cyclo-ligase [Paraglaciecola sp.]
MTEILPSRHALRQYYRQQRKQLSVQQQLQAETSLLNTFLQNELLGEANSVACYLATDSEIATSALISYLWQKQKRVVLPVLHPFTPGHLVFVEYHAHSPMQTNRYGILEPKLNCQHICPLEQIDVILTPLVAFDSLGNRLGMGGGYYDRTLAPVQRNRLATRIIGLAHECQLTEHLPTDGWDIPLHGIATPQRYIAIS